MLKLFLRNVKQGFATNSSSYHSTLVLDEEVYNKWVAGEIKIKDYYNDEISFDEWAEQQEDYEEETTYHTTPSGDRIVIICTHGSNY